MSVVDRLQIAPGGLSVPVSLRRCTTGFDPNPCCYFYITIIVLFIAIIVVLCGFCPGDG